MDAALQVIVRDGYDKVSIDAIAREAGVTRPVVYGAYDGLGPLLLALLDRQQTRALTQLAEVMPADPDLRDPERFILSTVSGLIDKVTNDPVTWQPILTAGRYVPTVVQERIDADRQRLRDQIASMLQTGLAGSTHARIDFEISAHAVLALLEHFGHLLLTQPELYSPPRLMNGLRGLLVALRPPHGG